MSRTLGADKVALYFRHLNTHRSRQNLRSRVLIQSAKRINNSEAIQKLHTLNLQIVKKQPMESTKQRGVFELLPLGTNLQSKVFNARPPTYWANILTAMMLYKKVGTGI